MKCIKCDNRVLENITYSKYLSWMVLWCPSCGSIVRLTKGQSERWTEPKCRSKILPPKKDSLGDLATSIPSLCAELEAKKAEVECMKADNREAIHNGQPLTWTGYNFQLVMADMNKISIKMKALTNGA